MVLALLALVVWGSALQAQSLADGIVAAEAGRLDDAERILSAVLKQQPDSYDANFYLGLTRFRAGNSAAARLLLERAVRLSPTNGRAWKTLGIVMTNTGDLGGALPVLEKACELAPNDEDACYYLARDLYVLGRYESAREPFGKALRAAPKVSKVHRGAALNFAAVGLPKEAEPHFLTAVQLYGRGGSEGEDPRIDYGAFLFRQGRTEEALRPLEQAVRDVPTSARANAELGRVLLQLDKLAAAAARLEKAVALEPGNWNARLLLGRAYLRLGRTAEGERETRLGQEGWAAKK